MKNIGVTGANGHVGANLVRRLLKKDFDIRVLQYRNHEAFDGLSVEVVVGDLNEPDSLVPFCDGLDVIIHLAAKISIGDNSYESLYKVNVEGTKNLVKAAKNKGVKRFIYFSTIDAIVHQPLDQPMDESRPLSTDSPMAYEKTKSLADQWILSQQSDNFDVIVLNPTAILGPFDFKPSLTGQLITRLYNNSLPGLVPGGYDWVDVRDVSEAAHHAIFQGKGGERYFLSGTWKSVPDFAKLLGSVTNKKINVTVFPLWAARMGLPFIRLYSKLSGQHPLYTNQSLTILQEGNKNILNNKARKELGYNPRPLAETLKDTVNWLKESKLIKE